MSIDRSRIAFWTLAVIAFVAVVAAVLARTSTPPSLTPTPTASLRLTLDLPDDLSLGGGPDYPFGLALAPDGRRLAFPAATSALAQLWLRDLSTGDTHALPGTEDGVLPFWAPDGRALGFFAGGSLRVLTLDNATVSTLADAPSPRGAAWHPNGDIVFAPAADSGLFRRHASDGRIERLTEVESGAGESSHRLPVLVNGGRHIMFFVRASKATRQGLWLASLDDMAGRKRLIGSESHGIAMDDVVMYASDGALVAQHVDFATLALTGRSMLLGTAVGHGPHNQMFATVDGDVLLYGAASSALRELRWFDHAGAASGIVGEPMGAWDVRIAPTGSSVAVTRRDPQLGTLDIWIYEGARPLPRRISRAIDVDESPVWSEDSVRLAWVTGRRTMAVRGSLAALPEETLRTFDHPVRVTDWSPDLRSFVVSESRPDTQADLSLIRATGRGEALPYARSPFNEVEGAISPDGRWMAYASDESGRFEIYVDSFPAPGHRARLSSGGGNDPRWRSDGGEVYFRRGTEVHGVMLSSSGAPPEAVSARRLFDAGAEIRAYDATPDGRRFLLNLPEVKRAAPPINVLVNVREIVRTLRGVTEPVE